MKKPLLTLNKNLIYKILYSPKVTIIPYQKPCQIFIVSSE